VGYFNYQFDEAGLEPFGPSLAANEAVVSAEIDPSGIVAKCDIATGTSELSATAAQRFCMAILKGHFEASEWYRPYMQGGHIDFSLRSEQTVRPVKPIKFLDPPLGAPVSIAYLSDRGCMVGRPTMSSSDSAAVCKAYEAAGRPHLTGTPPFLSASVGIALEGGPSPYKIYTYPHIADRGQAVGFQTRYPEELPLSRSEGRFSAKVAPNAYPSLALREGLEGKVSVMLGFDRSGTARSCRPVSSESSTLLANMTCGVLVRNSRFNFVSDEPQFTDLRYLVVPMIWVIPRD
jgi:hypothetical protein